MALYRYFQLTDSLPDTKRTTFKKLTSSTIREANESVRSVATKQSAKRRSYAKFTPEQQAEVAKYASMHGMLHSFSKEFETDLKDITVRSWKNKYLVEVGLGSTKIWAWSHVRRTRKLKTRKFLLKAPQATPRKFASPKIFRYTVRLRNETGNVT